MPRLIWSDVCSKVADLASNEAAPIFNLDTPITSTMVVDGVRYPAPGGRVRHESGLFLLLALRGAHEGTGVATIRPVATEFKNRVYEIDVSTLSRSSEAFKNVLINITNGIVADDDELGREIRLREREFERELAARQAEELAAENELERQREAARHAAAELEKTLKADTYGERYGSW